MKKERFLELQEEIKKLRDIDLTTADKVASKWGDKKKLDKIYSVLNSVRGSDLPFYLKCNLINKYLWRVHIRDCKIKVDTLILYTQEYGGMIEYREDSFESAFNPDNKPATKKAWESAAVKLVKLLK